MWKKVAFVVMVLAVGPALLWAGDNPKFLFGTGQIGIIEITVPPQIRCEGGVPTGSFPPCSEGTRRTFSRSEVQIWSPVSLSESVAGVLAGSIVFGVNCNLDAQYRGPCWGTFTWEVPGVGTWEGQWTAPVMDLLTYESEMSMVGFGHGGAIDGKQLKVDAYSNPGDWYISFAARINE